MDRIVHSQKGFLRYMQLSEATVFAFVEGKKIDPFFYGQICASVCKERQIKYELIKANELQPGAGGKAALLKYHDYLRSRKKLSSNLEGKRALAVFFLDKDIDDISKRLRKSRYIIYTRYYDVHNEIFLNGDLTWGCAAASSLDAADLSAIFSNSSQWCAQAAERWKDWVVLCVLTVLQGINHQCNYRVASQIQSTVTGAVDTEKLDQMKNQMAAKLKMSTDEFAAVHQSVSKLINKLYGAGKQDEVFKGKWYITLIDEDVRRLMNEYEYDKDKFSTRVTSTLATTLRFTDSWSHYYTGKLLDVLDNSREN